jgi:hypothetical protein
MSFLTVLFSRAHVPAELLGKWDFYEAEQAAALRTITKGTRIRRVVALVDTRESQKRIEAALREGTEPAQHDLSTSTPNWPAMVAQYALECVAEHQAALKAGLGDPGRHADAIATWKLVAREGRSGVPSREKLGKLVELAEARTVALVAEARRARKAERN